MQDFIFFIIIGSIAGLLSGLLGIGGGIIMVPGMLEFLNHQETQTSHAMQISIGTALSGITIMSLISGLSHRKLGKIRWDLVANLAPGTVTGAMIGVYVGDMVPSTILKILFASVLLIVIFQVIFFGSPATRETPILKPWALMVSGLGIGVFSGLVGLGGGLMIVPLLMINGIPLTQCASTAIWCTLPTVSVATVTAMWTGFNEQDLLPHCIGYVYWPATLIMCGCALVTAPLGVRLAHSLPKLVIKSVLVVVLSLIFLRLLFL